MNIQDRTFLPLDPTVEHAAKCTETGEIIGLEPNEYVGTDGHIYANTIEEYERAVGK